MKVPADIRVGAGDVFVQDISHRPRIGNRETLHFAGFENDRLVLAKAQAENSVFRHRGQPCEEVIRFFVGVLRTHANTGFPERGMMTRLVSARRLGIPGLPRFPNPSPVGMGDIVGLAGGGRLVQDLRPRRHPLVRSGLCFWTSPSASISAMRAFERASAMAAEVPLARREMEERESNPTARMVKSTISMTDITKVKSSGRWRRLPRT